MNYHKIVLDEKQLDLFLLLNMPKPSEDNIKYEIGLDRIKNPHNDSHKPAQRSLIEIEFDLKKKYLDTFKNLLVQTYEGKRK